MRLIDLDEGECLMEIYTEKVRNRLEYRWRPHQHSTSTPDILVIVGHATLLISQTDLQVCCCLH